MPRTSAIRPLEITRVCHPDPELCAEAIMIAAGLRKGPSVAVLARIQKSRREFVAQVQQEVAARRTAESAAKEGAVCAENSSVAENQDLS